MSWQKLAACKEAEPDMFHPEEAHHPGRAKKICAGCPVKKECLEFCLKVESPSARFGVWGGLSAYDREIRFDGRKPTPGRTHCSNGHEFTADNVLLVNGAAKRRCRICAEKQRAESDSRTHCKWGHELTVSNTCFRRGIRSCRLCERNRSVEWKKRKKVKV